LSQKIPQTAARPFSGPRPQDERSLGIEGVLSGAPAMLTLRHEGRVWVKTP
jgi:hypothetical protein